MQTAADKGMATDAPTAMIPAVLNYQKFDSQDALGHFLVKQYKIRTPHDLTSCEVCHR